MSHEFRDLLFLAAIAGGCGCLAFFLPDELTAIQVFDTYLAIGKWRLWVLLSVSVGFLFFASKQAVTGFSSAMGNRLTIALGFSLVPFLTIVSREAATLWESEKTTFATYTLLQQRTWQIQFAIVAYLVYVAYQWGSRER
ncbi:hypothetical protein [Fibrella arboris]|uniref:hypothetical protein n=1 Tax=Fibrella arboris TaxID=3242486 RepID=UPI003522B4AB